MACSGGPADDGGVVSGVEVRRSPGLRCGGRKKTRPPHPVERMRGAAASGAGQSADWMSLTSSPLGLAPAIDCTGLPFLNTVSVGTDMIR